MQSTILGIAVLVAGSSAVHDSGTCEGADNNVMLQMTNFVRATNLGATTLGPEPPLDTSAPTPTLLSGNAQCPQCICDLSQPDVPWSSRGSGCGSAFDDDLTWGPPTGVHVYDKLTLTFPGPVSIDHIDLHHHPYYTRYNPNFVIETSYDGAWTVRGSGTDFPVGSDGDMDPVLAFQFAAPVLATQVRLSSGRGVIRVEELQVFGRLAGQEGASGTPLNPATVDGCSLSGQEGEHPLTFHDDLTATADVRCCSLDGSEGHSQHFEGGVEFQGREGGAVYTGCMFGKTFVEAQAICAAADMRLCDHHEIDITCNTGCWHNVHAVWVIG